MTDKRFIAFDATYVVLYIGLAAGMVMLSALLIAFAALDIPFGGLQVAASVLNLVGWALLPIAPRLYRRVVGHPFSWRANGALGGTA